ncbi:MAG: hypothetical protein K2M47_06230 [Clostridiales bacterium]|nr:hypothetical protein [Clostridiales bacterium]
MQKKNGLNDSDKVFVAVALWIASIVIFATALTLPMLPKKVTIFYRPAESDLPDYYSKYNNLLLILMSLIPVAIILVTAFFKRRNRLQNNFISVMLFSIMLSLLISSVIIYGITEQFDSSSSVKYFNFHALATTVLLFTFSVLCSFAPMILHTASFSDGTENGKGYKWSVLRAVAKYWNVGAYGFLVAAIACVFTPEAYCYIPMVACVAAYIVFVMAIGNKDANKSV